MFGMLGSLAKAVVGAVVETPLAVIADVVTLGGVCTDEREPYTVSALRNVKDNVKDAARGK